MVVAIVWGVLNSVPEELTEAEMSENRFDETAFETARASGRPVFLNVTA